MKMTALVALVGMASLYWSPLAKRLFADPPNQIRAEQEEITLPAGNLENEPENSSPLNLAMKTGGGTQLWTDHAFRDGYRIQQNALTGHWRLLDGNDIRRAWGTRDQCDGVLDQLCPYERGKQDSHHVVVLLHGLMRTHHSMKPIESKLSQAGFEHFVRFSYASTRSSISDHAAALREVLEGMPPNTTFSFVGHSMGNIVVRHLVGDLQNDGDPKGLLPRCQAMVMLGPPNQGAAIARRLAPTGVFEWITGKGGMELGPEWEEFVRHLATPPFPFLVIAGDLSENLVSNPLVEGSSDFVVSVKEAELEGSESFETVPVLHSFLMNDESVQQATIDFIKSHSATPNR